LVALLQTVCTSARYGVPAGRARPTRAVFVAKLVQAVLPTFCFMSLFHLPALIGLGIARGKRQYFVMLPVTLVL